MRIRHIQLPAYNGFQEVNVSFESHFKPQIFPITGNNGSGKTFLLKLIYDLLRTIPVNSGEIGIKLAKLGMFESLYSVIKIELEYEGQIHELKYGLTLNENDGFIVASQDRMLYGVKRRVLICLNVDGESTLIQHELLKNISTKIKFISGHSNHWGDDYGKYKLARLQEWVTHYATDKGVILIDNIEDGLDNHTQDWMKAYLQKWAPDSQFVIATHSYDICDGLIPRQVKVLQPPKVGTK